MDKEACWREERRWVVGGIIEVKRRCGYFTNNHSVEAKGRIVACHTHTHTKEDRGFITSMKAF
jgi:hypothetical protein